MSDIASTFPYAKKRIEVLGRSIAYVEAGEGDPVVFLHGNPTSSFLWRNVIPHLDGSARCIAPDLIGMGDSEKLGPELGADRYGFLAYRSFVDAFLDAIGARRDVTLVGQDWGGALAFDWASRHPEALRGIAYMETVVMPLNWTDWPEEKRGLFQALRSPSGERLALEENVMIERILPLSVLRELTEEEMAAYRAPFSEPGESRAPLLAWPREWPVEGEPAGVVEIVDAYGSWLSTSTVPKLFVNADPGSTLVDRARDFCRSWPNQEEVTVRGDHFPQEDSPNEIGTALAAWYRRLLCADHDSRSAPDETRVARQAVPPQGGLSTM